MMRVPSVLAVLAAAAAAQPATKPAPPPVEGEIVDEKNPPAAVVKVLATVPRELTDANPWIGRRYMTGYVRAKSDHETFTLQRHGSQALVTHEVKTPSRWKRGRGLDHEILAWRTQSLTQYIGTVEEKGGTVKLALANGTDKLELTCRKAKVAAARADATRGRSPKWANEECGDPGRWVPGATTSISVIRCDVPEYEGDDPWDKIAFAPAPGIEWLHVNDDCVIQGGGWRQVPADQSIKPPRQVVPRASIAPSKAPAKAPGKAAR